MKTLIISSSRNPQSLSREVCKEIKNRLEKKENTEVALIDLSEMEINFAFQPKTPDQEKIQKLVEESDNFIFGTPIYNYGFSDSLKAMLDTCFPGSEHKLFGIIAAAGGEKSYLSTMSLVQTCMKEWRMIPLPRTVYCMKKDFESPEDTPIPKDELCQRIQQFIEDFHSLGSKLIN